MSKAVQFAEYGGPEVLKLVEVDQPQADAGQVRIAVRAAGVNPIEYKVRSGFMAQRRPIDLPAGLGSELAGVIDQVGEGVEGLGAADEVLGFSLTPAYAEYALADPKQLVRKPSSLDWAPAGGVAIGARTAYTVLGMLELQPGETLLIHAAAGGVGVIATQLARARGVEVIGTASEPNHDFLRSIGATPVAYGEGLAERVRALAPGGVDAVFDASGRGELAVSVELAGGAERVVTIAAYDSAEYGVRFAGPPEAAKFDSQQAMQEVVDLIAQGKLEVAVWKTYALADAAAAAAESENAHLRGKIILLPG